MRDHSDVKGIADSGYLKEQFYSESWRDSACKHPLPVVAALLPPDTVSDGTDKTSACSFIFICIYMFGLAVLVFVCQGEGILERDVTTTTALPRRV